MQIFRLPGVARAGNKNEKIFILQLIKIFFERSRNIPDIPGEIVGLVTFVPVFRI
jgi:hypothetical protein